jgi:hypothetical protein
MQWVGQFPPGAARNTALFFVAENLVKGDPALAVQWARQQLPEHDGQTPVLNGVAIGLINADPKESMQWVEQLPPGSARNTALFRVAQALAKNDPAAAVRWAKQYPREKNGNNPVADGAAVGMEEQNP